MFNLDPGKLLVIAVVAIILLGPDKLPQFARQVGGAWRAFNDFRHRMESEVRSTMPDLPPTSEIARLARSPSALLNHLSTMSSEDEDETAADGAVTSTVEGAVVDPSTNGVNGANGAAEVTGEEATAPFVPADAPGADGLDVAAPAAETETGPEPGAHDAEVTAAPASNGRPAVAPAPSAPAVSSAPAAPAEVAPPVDPTLN